MIRNLRTRLFERPLLFAAIAVAILLTRSVATSATDAPQGLVPICVGGEVVYISLTDDGEPSPGGETERQVCPWLGLQNIDIWEPLSPVAECAAGQYAHWPIVALAAFAVAHSPYLSRAPPLSA